MSMGREVANVSPSTTYCSELEYLIALDSEEYDGFQLRRSQRLREKENAAKAAQELKELASPAVVPMGASSPQLFDEMDGVYSQLPPNRIISDNHSNTCVVVQTQEAGAEKCATAVRRYSNSWQYESSQLKVVNMLNEIHSEPLPKSASNSEFKERASCKGKRQRSSNKTSKIRPARRQSKPIKPSRSSAGTGRGRRRTKTQPAAIKISKVDMEPYGQQTPVCNPTQYTSSPRKIQTSMVTSRKTQTSYQIMNSIPTKLPERYPDHFIHQLPSSANFRNEAIPINLQRINSEAVSLLNTEQLEVNSTPVVDPEMESLAALDGESLGSTTPSLSESLAEVFGTKNIRNVLKIEAPRKYLVQDVHLPAMAIMLGVEVARLRAILGLTQRLTLEQLQQLAQESPISIHSSSDEDYGIEMQCQNQFAPQQNLVKS